MKTQRMVKMWLVVLGMGLCCCSAYEAYGESLVGHYDFAGTTGGNVPDTVSGRNLTGYKWSSTDPNDYFQLWSGRIVADINMSPFSVGWATLWQLDGTTTGDWDKVMYGIWIPPGSVTNFTPYRPNLGIGTTGNGQWKYLNDDGPEAIPRNQLSTVTVGWQFDDVSKLIHTAIWIDGALRGSNDMSFSVYPGYGGNQWRLNNIDFSQFTQGQFSEIWIYEGFQMPMFLAVSPESRTVDPNASQVTFDVSNTGLGQMNWTTEVIDGNDWLSISSGSSGTNSGTITANLTENNGVKRTGKIRITASGAENSPTDVSVIQNGLLVAAIGDWQFNEATSGAAPAPGVPITTADLTGNGRPLTAPADWTGSGPAPTVMNWTEGQGGAPNGAMHFVGHQWPNQYWEWVGSYLTKFSVYAGGAISLNLNYQPGHMAYEYDWNTVIDISGTDASSWQRPVMNIAFDSYYHKVNFSYGASRVGGPYMNLASPDYAVPTNQWCNVHVAWHRNNVPVAGGLTVTIWVNGVQVATSDNMEYYPVETATPGWGVNIDYIKLSNNVYAPFSGLIDGVKIYDEYVEPPKILDVSPQNRTVNSSASQVTFDVNNVGAFQMDWTAEVIDGNGWLSISSGSSGTNFGTITVDVATNTGAQRTGTIRVLAPGAEESPADVTVTQTTGLVSRGHAILMDKGLQIHALVQVGNDPTIMDRWPESNFTGADMGYGSVDSYLAADTQWSRGFFNGTDDLDPNDLLKLSTLVGVHLKDEQDITDPCELAEAAAWMAYFQTQYPSVMTFTNQPGIAFTSAQIKNYMAITQPDMLMFDVYPFEDYTGYGGPGPAGGSPTRLYNDLQKYRLCGLAGNDDTGSKPIPYGLHMGTFKNIDNGWLRYASDSEMRLNQFAAWTFGGKFVDAFVYNSWHNTEGGIKAPFFNGWYHGTATQTMWITDPCDLEGYITYDMGNTYNLDGFHFWNLNASTPSWNPGGYGIKTMDVYVSTDSDPNTASWTLWGRVNPHQALCVEWREDGQWFNMPDTSARLVKFDIIDHFIQSAPMSGPGGTFNPKGYCGFSEVKFLEVGNRTPLDGVAGGAGVTVADFSSEMAQYNNFATNTITGLGLYGDAGAATSFPTAAFDHIAETNRQSRNLGPTLVRLLSTDVKIVRGLQGSVPGTLNPLPAGMSDWTAGPAGVDPYITAITATNLGIKNNGLRGDVLVGLFEPLLTAEGSDTYFMITNGLSDRDGLVSETRQQIVIDFNFGSSGITSLQRLSRQTGQVSTVPLQSLGGSSYRLTLELDGGTGDLFKFNTGAPFVGGVVGTCGDEYHPYPEGDLDQNCYVDFKDVKLFALYWLDSSCTVGTQCADADVKTDTVINFADFAVIAAEWMDCTDPNQPCNYNP